MSEPKYRLFLKGFYRNIEYPVLMRFFRKEYGIEAEHLRRLLNGIPGVLFEFDNREEAQRHRADIAKLGGIASVEEVVTDGGLPLAVTRSIHHMLKKELSKILRSRSSLALFVVKYRGNSASGAQLSMLKTEKELGRYFRECDTIAAVDDRYLLIVGFATDKHGATFLKKKILRAFRDIHGEDAGVSVGLSLFPEEGQTVEMLLKIAEKNRLSELPDGEARTEITEKQPAAAPAGQEAASRSLLSLCFSEARGKVLQRLLSMDAETLWVGLSQVSFSMQREFFCRLPYDSPLVKPLGHKIKKQSLAGDAGAIEYFKAIIHQMSFEQRLEARKALYEKVITKLNRVESLPTLSAIAMQIFHITSDSDSGLNELADVIKNDPALTLKILKIVNSAFYGFQDKIHSINHALVILGGDEIRNLAFGLAVAKVLENTGGGSRFSPENLWHHSMGTALIGTRLSRYLTDYPDADLFTAGLLHDFGKIFLMENFAGDYNGAINTVIESEVPLYGAEEDHFGISHTAIGRLIAANWNLPEGLVEAIAFHHHPSAASKYQSLAALVGLADYLYYRAVTADEPLRETPRFSAYLSVDHVTLLRSIISGFDEQIINDLTQTARNILEDNREIFEMITSTG